MDSWPPTGPPSGPPPEWDDEWASDAELELEYAPYAEPWWRRQANLAAASAGALLMLGGIVTLALAMGGRSEGTDTQLPEVLVPRSSWVASTTAETTTTSPAPPSTVDRDTSTTHLTLPLRPPPAPPVLGIIITTSSSSSTSSTSSDIVEHVVAIDHDLDDEPAVPEHHNGARGCSHHTAAVRHDVDPMADHELVIDVVDIEHVDVELVDVEHLDDRPQLHVEHIVVHVDVIDHDAARGFDDDDVVVVDNDDRRPRRDHRTGGLDVEHPRPSRVSHRVTNA